MGCKDCDDNKIPTTIPVGSDGKSVTIAYASDASGTNFSYTPSATLTYISFVVKSTAVTQSDFTTWTEYIGSDGTNGTNGVGISNVYISDGVTAIGGTVYPVNTIVTLMTDSTYINAGVVETCTGVWTDLTLLNGWTDVNAGEPIIPLSNAQYKIECNMIYFRGVINRSLGPATSSTVATLPIIPSIPSTIYSTISDCDATTPVFSQVVIGTDNSLKITEYSNGNAQWVLNTIAPFPIV